MLCVQTPKIRSAFGKLQKLLQGHSAFGQCQNFVVEFVHHLTGEHHHVLAHFLADFATFKRNDQSERNETVAGVVFETTVQHRVVCGVQGFSHLVAAIFRNFESQRRFDVHHLAFGVYKKVQRYRQIFAYCRGDYFASVVVASVLPIHFVQRAAKSFVIFVGNTYFRFVIAVVHVVLPCAMRCAVETYVAFCCCFATFAVAQPLVKIIIQQFVQKEKYQKTFVHFVQTVYNRRVKRNEKIMKIQNEKFGEERALYRLADCIVENCLFDGEEDGESALKETNDVTVNGCQFRLRYPLWHCGNFVLKNCVFSETSRAPLWYDKNGRIQSCEILSVKPLRECDDVEVAMCKIISPETGWKCRNLKIFDSAVTSEYFLLDSQNVEIDNLKMEGKYSFQYMKNVKIENSVLNTKDAFWHSQNVVVKNCRVVGEYLGWYSDGLTFENCEIVGTQPLCYCKNLVLKNCTMTDCDLAFEYSDVYADVIGNVLSVKNPKSGRIVADGVGEIILKNSVYPDECEIVIRKK